MPSFYVMLGHSGVPAGHANKDVPLGAGTELVFYCNEGELSTTAETRNGANGTFQKMFQRLTLVGQTPPDEFVHERVDGNANGTYKPYLVYGDAAMSNMGLYYVTYTAGNPLREKELIFSYPGQGTTIMFLLTKIKQHYATQMTDNDVLRIHWLGCRGLTDVPGGDPMDTS